MRAAAPGQGTGGAAGRLDERAKVMLVDDEPAVVRSLGRHLRARFRVETCTDPVDALDRLHEHPDLAVLVSDMRMPRMDGATLLAEVADRRPDVTRVLLTGFSEIDAAIKAINQGRVFRFLSKPIPPQDLVACLDDAVAQHALVHAERELLEETLRGSVQALTDTMAMADPVAFARATRIRGRLAAMAAAVDAPDPWEVEVAGQLGHLGAVSLPSALNERLMRGQRLTPKEQELVDGLPSTAIALLEGIPRLGGVRRIIALQRQRFDGRGPVEVDLGGDRIPLGARLLHLVADYDALEARGDTVGEALDELRGRVGRYDPRLLDALEALVAGDDGRDVVRIPVVGLAPGQVLAEDLTTTDGKLLAPQGQEMTERMVERLVAWSAHTDIQEPVVVYAETPT